MSIELALEIAQHNAVTARLPESAEFGRIADLIRNPWQPISTAPTDGRMIFAYEEGFIPFAAWMDEGQWQNDEGANCPTHWMPMLPPTPEVQS